MGLYTPKTSALSTTMSSAALPRLALRQSRWVIQRRAASTTTEAASNTASQGASKAKEGASEAAGKAQQGLSRVTSSAGSAVSSTAASAGKALNNVGGRTGQAIQFVQGLIPPTIYYARVAGELGKIMVQGRNMYPPTMQTVQSYMTPLQNALRNPGHRSAGGEQPRELACPYKEYGHRHPDDRWRCRRRDAWLLHRRRDDR